MGYLRDFEEDVFISYATIDNDRFPGEPAGWVSQLHEDLGKRLQSRLGSDQVRLWRDVEIRNNEDFTVKIVGRLSKTATLLGILSPSFLTREWTLRELETFVQNAGLGIGLLVKADKSRIFKVEKMEVPLDALPPALRGTKSYRFIKQNAKTEFRPYIDADRSGYWQQLDDLAIDIAALLREMADPTPAADRLAVYVAETTTDLASQLRDVRRELKDRGYLVLPESDLSRNATDYIKEVKANLDLAVLSVHLIGERYGLIPEGDSRSIVRMQHDLAMERGAGRDFARLIWMPRDQRPAESAQSDFIAYIQNDAAVQSGAEIVEAPIEEMKTILLDKLESLQRARADSRPPPPDDEPPTIYVICDQRDAMSPHLDHLRNYFYDQNCEPVVQFSNSQADLTLTKHLNNLKTLDAFLIFYEAGSVDWLEDKLGDFRQYLRGRDKPPLAKGLYLAPPESAHKRQLRTNEAMVLRGGHAFAGAAIDPFLQRIRSARQTRP